MNLILIVSDTLRRDCKVQRKMDNRLLSLSDNQYGPLLFDVLLPTGLLSIPTRCGQLAAALGHELAVQAF